jgi:hypothetical protein
MNDMTDTTGGSGDSRVSGDSRDSPPHARHDLERIVCVMSPIQVLRYRFVGKA